MAKFKGTDKGETLYGTDGDDVIRSLGGNDGLVGGDGDDRLFGGDGDDVFYEGAGTDFLSGGDGNDAVYFGYAATGGPDLIHGVHVNLAKEFIANDGYGNTGTIRSVETVNIGGVFGAPSPYVDWLRGNAADNFFDGLGDRDQVHGGAGDDAFRFYGANDAVIDGGAGSDGFSLEAVRYVIDPDTGEVVEEDAKQGIVVDLARGVVENDGFGGHTDRVIAMENVRGAVHDDVLTGNDRANVLIGDRGDDVLTGGRGRDELFGGIGHDTYVFALGDSGKTDESADVIQGFVQRQGDRIDLSAISQAIGHTLTFIGDDPFSGAAGEVRYDAYDDLESGHSLIQIDANGDGKVDMAIATGNYNIVYFAAADFIF